MTPRADSTPQSGGSQAWAASRHVKPRPVRASAPPAPGDFPMRYTSFPAMAPGCGFGTEMVVPVLASMRQVE